MEIKPDYSTPLHLSNSENGYMLDPKYDFIRLFPAIGYGIINIVTETGIVPDALTMDVEGAELLILRGARQTLKMYKPKVWISIHPDLGERDYGITKEETLKFMQDLGYKSEFLAKDHEEHWYFYD